MALEPFAARADGVPEPGRPVFRVSFLVSWISSSTSREWDRDDKGIFQGPGLRPGKVLKDSQGTVTDISDNSGNPIQHYVYSTFGEILGYKTAGLGGGSTTQPPIAPSLTYAGRQFDPESGLYYYRARYYNPGIGRFLQKDPEPGKLAVPITVVNAYAYAGNNPANFNDPTGRIFGIDDAIFWTVIGIFALVGAGSNLKDALRVPGASFAKILGSALFGGLAGALNGLATLIGGPIAGAVASAITSGFNNAVNQAIFTGSVNLGQAFSAGLIGGVLSFGGYGLAKLGLGKVLTDLGISLVGSSGSTVGGSFFAESGIPVPAEDNRATSSNCGDVNVLCHGP